MKRGYIIVEKQLTETISGRITPDISLDQEGDGRGDIELRLKYLYVKFKLPSVKIFTKPYIEFGLAHRPWLDFEEHLYRYRVQGTMFIERNHIINSADLGFTLVSLLGGEIDEEYQTTVNNRYPGRYGSFAVGVYNGGGYHAIEENDKKSIEGRFSLRPLPDILPGFQISYHGVYGYGNTAEAPKWTVNQGLLSFENQYYTATVQYYTGIGSSSGIYKIGDDIYEPYNSKNKGYSLFGRVKIGDSGFGLIGRYDYFKRDIEPKSVSSQRYLQG